MFFRYAYRKENGKTVLYLYKTAKFEFAKEAIAPHEEKFMTLEDEAISFVNKKNLPQEFDKLCLVVDGNIIKSLSKEEVVSSSMKKQATNYDETLFKVIVRESNQQEEMSLFKYLIGTLFANASFPLHKEAIKALTILFRTYALSQMKEKGFIEARNPFVIYKEPLQYKFSYSKQFQEIYNVLREAILETQGFYLLSNGTFIQPYIHFVSSGRTKTNGKDAYLISKESLWDLKAPNYLQQTFFSYSTLKTKYSITKENLKHYTRKEIAYLLGIPSLNFTCIEEKEGFTILSRGVGNDLGLSIFGANYLAEQGFNYSQILAYYFQNIVLYKLKTLNH